MFRYFILFLYIYTFTLSLADGSHYYLHLYTKIVFLRDVLYTQEEKSIIFIGVFPVRITIISEDNFPKQKRTNCK